MPENMIGSSQILNQKVHFEDEVVTPPNNGGGGTVTPPINTPYYLDGYSLMGSGTQADPIRYTGNHNDVNPGPEFDNVANLIPIPADSVLIWFDGMTIGTKEQNVVGWENGVSIGEVKDYGSDFYARGQPFSLYVEEVFNDQVIITI